MRILHLSDTHIGRIDGPDGRRVDATDSLRLILHELRHQRGVDAVVVTGDLADDGSVEAYTTVRELVGDFARSLDAPVFYTTGNHDERSAFAKVLGSGHADAVRDFPGEERAAVSTVGGWRIVTLDSLVPGKVYGRIGAGQLDWLRDVLSVPAEHGTVLAFHHPPISLDISAMQQVFGLRDPGGLAAAIRGSDVRVLLTGHFHLQLFGLLDASVPVWVTPGVVNRIDLTTVPGTERAVRGASASLVELGGATGPMFHTFHARDPRAHETVYELDEERTREVIARHG
ncbi:metallophosphoesterase family protein [Streptomyces sp. NBC_01235]|uniref:metallophosphoesterase family protein n=1 Tax=Streptomyces sp. NBC_01235 TaxID=2903788 RepID=UPI002E0D2F18|nr:metallophosphoesterase [Streptomyces sp. NBC_01235]